MRPRELEHSPTELEHPPKARECRPKGLDAIRIVLVAPSHPGNIGAAARAMLTMGLTRLVLVAPRRFPDPEAAALASGATAVLDNASVVADTRLRARGLRRRESAFPRGRASSPAGCCPFAMRRPKAIGLSCHGDVALVFGTEMSGLSNAELARCGIVATIPTNAEYASLNLAAAVQVVAYELHVAATSGDVWRAPRFEPATVDEIEALYAHANVDARRRALSRSADAEAPAATAAPAVRTGRAREGGGQHPARNPCANRSAARPPVTIALPAAASTTGDDRAAGAWLRELRRTGSRILLPRRAGKRHASAVPTFRQFMRDATGRYIAYDGKFWRTLAALLLRPGFLTREYLAGRRHRYIGPARLFLVASLLLFATLRFATESIDLDHAIEFDPPKHQRPRIEKPAPPQRFEKPDADGDFVMLDDDFNLNLSELAGASGSCGSRSHGSTACRSAQKVEQLKASTLRYGPYAMFALLPAFAALLKVVYLGRTRRYPSRPRLYGERLVFAAHNHAFIFVAGSLVTILSRGFVVAAVAAWMLVYLVWSTRVVYGGRWLGIAARAMVLGFAYLTLFALVTVGLVVAAVLLR
jgi:TrmH family RNA methyltransferase